MKTKLFSFFLALAASVGTMFADGTKIGDLYYNLNATDKTAEVTYELHWNDNNYKGLTTANIPASVTYSGTTYSVTSIGNNAFDRCSSLTSVTIGNSVTSIGEAAFDVCTGLTSLTIPNSVTSIGGSAFYNCSSLTSVTIPNNVTSIGYDAFRNCSGLTSVTIGNSVTSIGHGAFYYCSSLKKVNITDIAAWCNIAFGSDLANPLNYAKHLFVNDIEVTELVIPNGVTSIGQCAFCNCSSLTSVTIPNSVTSIGNLAFTGCNGLTSVTIPNSVTSIGEYAFSGCSSFTSVESPAILFNEAFGIFNLAVNEMPSQIKHLTITAGTLTEEGFDRIRASYRNLESVDLANAESTELSDEAFKGCYNLQTLRLPAGLKEIKYMAVAECVKLQAIDIPVTVESIGDRAFEDCRSMATVTFAGNAIQSIGCWAFYNCHALQNIVIPEGVTEIGDGAFYGCTYLADVSVPATARIIGDNAFALCSKMAKLTVYAAEPPAIAAKTFDEVSRTMPVYVPTTSIHAYKADLLWGQMNIIDGTTATETLDITPAITKILRDGEVLILRDGKTYTIQGVEVR